jgi:hypothetical protein
MVGREFEVHIMRNTASFGGRIIICRKFCGLTGCRIGVNAKMAL